MTSTTTFDLDDEKQEIAEALYPCTKAISGSYTLPEEHGDITVDVRITGISYSINDCDPVGFEEFIATNNIDPHKSKEINFTEYTELALIFTEDKEHIATVALWYGVNRQNATEIGEPSTSYDLTSDIIRCNILDTYATQEMVDGVIVDCQIAAKMIEDESKE